jgi:hypothetical protein
VVLERDEIEAGAVCDLRQLDRVLRLLRDRHEERAEAQVVSVVHVRLSVLYLPAFAETYFETASI